jgi:hypothetical protein
MKNAACLSLILLLGCRSAPSPTTTNASIGDSCAVDADPPLDATGRRDGLYGVRNHQLDKNPLASLAGLRLEAEGSDAAGKRWLRLQLNEDEARRLREFTAVVDGRSIAVVASGQIASHHKVRTQVGGGRHQVSCCDPHAWRLRSLLRGS